MKIDMIGMNEFIWYIVCKIYVYRIYEIYECMVSDMSRLKLGGMDSW